MNKKDKLIEILGCIIAFVITLTICYFIFKSWSPEFQERFLYILNWDYNIKRG